MSVLSDFLQVWSQRFPDKRLPKACEEHIRFQLNKHKEKVDMFMEEVRKEETHIEYLERLLCDIEKLKGNGGGELDLDLSGERGEITLRREEASPTPTKVGSDSPATSLHVDKCETLSANMCVTEMSKELLTAHTKISNSANADVNSDTFVTVIQVSGLKSASKDDDDNNKTPDCGNDQPSVIDSSGNHRRVNDDDGGNVDYLQETTNINDNNHVENHRHFESQQSNESRIESSSLDEENDGVISGGDEPYYDLVAGEEVPHGREAHTENSEPSSSSAENTLLHSQRNHSNRGKISNLREATANYVNIEYFIQAKKQVDETGEEHSSSDDEEEEELLPTKNTNNSYASSSSLDPSTPSTSRKFNINGEDINNVKDEKSEKPSLFMCILLNIVDSEANYVEWLSVLLELMKEIQPIVSEVEINTIFYKIPELYELHSTFLTTLRNFTSSGCRSPESSSDPSQQPSPRIGDCFKTMATNLKVYDAFLNNYGRAMDTVQKCAEENSQFASITKNITCKHLSKQPVSLEVILHKPVARVQKNALVMHDLVNALASTSHLDYPSLLEALNMTQHFLDEFNMIQTTLMFPMEDRTQRRLVKNSFIVEFSDGQRKLRHLFLFNDVIACVKYKPYRRTEKYTFELKWFIPVAHISILTENCNASTTSLSNCGNSATTNGSHTGHSNSSSVAVGGSSPGGGGAHHEVSTDSLIQLKSQAAYIRDQLQYEERLRCDKKKQSRHSSRTFDKLRKRLVEIESQLVLVSHTLPFRLRNNAAHSSSVRHLTSTSSASKAHTFYLSSEFERTQWTEAIRTLQRTNGSSQAPASAPPAVFTMLEVQTWITACRAFLKSNMGSYLLRSGQDGSLLNGDLLVTIGEFSSGVAAAAAATTPSEYGGCEAFIVLEVDFYGHFFQKVKTKTTTIEATSGVGYWGQNYSIDLEGCENVRILMYRNDPAVADKCTSSDNTNNSCDEESKTTLLGKFTQKLSRQWLHPDMPIDRRIPLSGTSGLLTLTLRFVPSEVSSRRVPAGKTGPIFGEKIESICKRQKREIPFLITACIREVERRGLSEVGIYRVSGSSADIAKLKKSFESNAYEAEQLLKEVDINSVTGILKLYLRELPEALFTDHFYPALLKANKQSDNNISVRRTELLKEQFLKLPTPNKAIILYILNHLICISQHDVDNKMSLQNLATVFGPTLLRPVAKSDQPKNKDSFAIETVDVMAQANIVYCLLQDFSNKKAKT